MSIRTFVAVSLLATAVAAVAAGPAGSPKGAPAAHAGNAQGLAAPGPNTKEKLIGTYNATGNGVSTALPQFAFTTIASNTIKCGNATGCSVGIGTMSQIQSAGADWAICLLIDGTSVSCQYQGVQSGPSSYVVGNARGWGTVSSGTHTVDTQLYTESASATYQYFQTDVNVYKP
jgi:hypothetical protein